MKRLLTTLLLGITLAAALPPLSAQTIVVSAAASLKEALGEVNTAFLAKNPAWAST